MIMFYAISQLAIKFFMPQTPQPNVQTPASDTYDQNDPQVSLPVPNPWQLDPLELNPVVPSGTKLAVHVYLSQSFGYDMFSENERRANRNLPSITWENLTWGDWSWTRSAEYLIDVPEVIQVIQFSLPDSFGFRQFKTMAHYLHIFS